MKKDKYELLVIDFRYGIEYKEQYLYNLCTHLYHSEQINVFILII